MELNYSRMIGELLNERRLHAFERDDLRFYQEKGARGRLTAADKAVVLRISRRLNGAAHTHTHTHADQANGSQPAQPSDHAAELEELRQQLSASRLKEEQASRERDAAETRVFQLEVRVRGLLAREQQLTDQLAEPRSRSGHVNGSEGDKFKRVRAEFARLYHPDNIKMDGMERRIRTEIFKEFWIVLRDLEKS